MDKSRFLENQIRSLELGGRMVGFPQAGMGGSCRYSLSHRVRTRCVEEVPVSWGLGFYRNQRKQRLQRF